MAINDNNHNELQQYVATFINKKKSEDTKGVIRRRKSKKDRQHNGYKSVILYIRQLQESKSNSPTADIIIRC